MVRPRRGFTLLEITIVVSIIALLTAFAVPSYLRSRINSAETSAIASCRTINVGCQSFYGANPARAYPANLADLTATNPPYLDAILGGGTKQGYQFVYTQLDAQHFEVRGSPVTPGVTGARFFYVDQTGVVRVNANGLAGPADPPVE